MPQTSGRRAHMEPFSLAFLDPPYGKGLGEKALVSLSDGGWLAPGAVIVLEERANASVELPKGFTELDRRSYGEAQVIFVRYEGCG